MTSSALTRTELANNSNLQKDYVEDVRSRSRKISVQQGLDKRGRGRMGKNGGTLEEVPEAVAINEEAGDLSGKEVCTLFL